MRRIRAVPARRRMSFLWQTHLGGTTPFEPAYHQNPRTEIASFINEPPETVLDIGCGGGATGRLIKKKFPGTLVIGIEYNPQAAEHARQYLDRVLCGNIETLELGPGELGPAPIRTVLLLDVLEHLVDPWRVLVKIRQWLAPGTRILASLPNIRNLVTLDELASGRWEYGADGVLDITHLRFFTAAGIRRLFEETGYEVRAMEPLTQPELVERVVTRCAAGRVDTGHVSVRFRSAKDLDELYAFQYVVDAYPAPAQA